MVAVRLNEINKMPGFNPSLHLKHGITVYRRLVHGNGEKSFFFPRVVSNDGTMRQLCLYKNTWFLIGKESEVTNSPIVESSNTW